MICKKETDYYPIIELCYSEDPEMISTYHILSGTDYKTCAKHETNILKPQNIDFLSVYNNNDLIGYFGKHEETIENELFSVLTTIFVRPKYRKKEFMKDFWELINNSFDNKKFITGIYQKNTRCEKFFKKFAKKDIYTESNGNKIVVFVFNI